MTRLRHAWWWFCATQRAAWMDRVHRRLLLTCAVSFWTGQTLETYRGEWPMWQNAIVLALPPVAVYFLIGAIQDDRRRYFERGVRAATEHLSMRAFLKRGRKS